MHYFPLSGNVFGPVSAVDNSLVRFDLTTGKLLQASGLTLSDVSGGLVTLATTTTNGGLVIAPNGTGQLQFVGSDATSYAGVQTAPALLAGDSGIQYVATGNYSGLTNTVYGNGVANVYPYFHTLAANGTAASPTNLGTSALEGAFIWGAYANGQFRQNVQMLVTTDSGFGNSEYGATWSLGTKSGTGGMTDRLTVDKNGVFGVANRQRIGTTDDSSVLLNVSSNLTSAGQQYDFGAQSQVQSSLTTGAYGYYAGLGTQATSFTLANLRNYGSFAPSVGAGSLITTFSQFYANDAGVNTAAITNAYAFHGAQTAGTGRYNLNMSGTAENFLGGVFTQKASGTTTTGGVSTTSRLVKTVSAIANNTATATITVTIPNASHSGVVRVTLLGSLGAGGAVGANEASGSATYDIAVARTAGVNAVAVASTAYGSAMVNVAGAATITVTAAPSAISGAVGSTNTFTVNVTIARGSGSSTNHTCLVSAEIINANATGITIN